MTPTEKASHKILAFLKRFEEDINITDDALRKSCLEYSDAVYNEAISNLTQKEAIDKKSSNKQWQITNIGEYELTAQPVEEEEIIISEKNQKFQSVTHITAGGSVNFIGRDNVGSPINYFPLDDSRENNIKQTTTPNTKDNRTTAITAFIVKFWWLIVIPICIAFISLLIEYTWFV